MKLEHWRARAIIPLFPHSRSPQRQIGSTTYCERIWGMRESGEWVEQSGTLAPSSDFITLSPHHLITSSFIPRGINSYGCFHPGSDAMRSRQAFKFGNALRSMPVSSS